MTKKELKQFHEWATGEINANESVKNDELEFDSVTDLQSIPRVIYLKSLGYTIKTWEAYVWAEIDQMGIKKVA